MESQKDFLGKWSAQGSCPARFVEKFRRLQKPPSLPVAIFSLHSLHTNLILSFSRLLPIESAAVSPSPLIAPPHNHRQLPISVQSEDLFLSLSIQHAAESPQSSLYRHAGASWRPYEDYAFDKLRTNMHAP
ncbi:hypothetical protein LguiB_032181 [Lonicera macranthoides]